MSIKITDGTPNFSQPSLCLSCRNGQTVTGLRLNDGFTLCRLHGMQAIHMPQPVMTCSDYDDSATPQLYQMEKIAWRFSLDDKKKIAGFVTPQDWKQRVKEGKELEDD